MYDIYKPSEHFQGPQRKCIQARGIKLISLASWSMSVRVKDDFFPWFITAFLVLRIVGYIK